ncbi:MAG: PAS domain S-box protein [bacterium]
MPQPPRSGVREATTRVVVGRRIEDLGARISARFAMGEDVDDAIAATLGDLGNHLGAVRVSLFQLRPDGDWIDASHEWYRHDHGPALVLNQNLACTHQAWCMRQIDAHGFVRLASVAQMPEEACDERRLLSARGVESLLAMAVPIGSTVGGIIRIDNPTTDGVTLERTLTLARHAAHVIGLALSRRRTEEELRWHVRLDELVMRAAATLLEATPESIDAAITGILTELATTLGADIGYVLDRADDVQARVITHVGRSAQSPAFPAPDPRDLDWLELDATHDDQVLVRRRSGSEPTLDRASAATIGGEESRALVATFRREPSRRGTLVFEVRGARRNWGRDTQSSTRIAAGMIASALHRTDAVRALRDSEARFRLLTESAHDAIAEFTAEGICLYANRRHCEILGLEPRMLVGEPLLPLVHPDDQASVIASFVEAREHRSSARGVIRFRDARGGYRWLETVGTWFTAASGEERVVGVSRDVTDARAGEEELRRSEALRRAITDHSIDMITVVRSDGTIAFQNLAADRVLGYAFEELGDVTAEQFVHPDDLELAWSGVQACVSSRGQPITAELRVRRRDGDWRTVTATAINLIGDPGVDGILVMSRDVTEQRQTEQALRRREDELRQAQKMEAIGRLAGGVAHDFNNMLSVVQCHTDMMLSDLPTDHPMRDGIGSIRDAGLRAAALTRQLLAFSRKQAFVPRPVDVSGVVTAVSKMLKTLIGEDVRFDVRLATDLPTVLIDVGYLEQVLMNLAVNSRDAMPQGGELRIETEKVDGAGAHGAALGAGDWVRLSVIDSGCGMDAQTLQHAFEPFFTTKPRDKGTGLGLATVYGIVKQSGGEITVSSQPGLGTRFDIFLPSATSEPEPIAEGVAPVATESRGHDTILLVEDEPTVREIAAQVLESGGFRVLSAGSVAQAVGVIDSAVTMPALVVSDVVLPDGSGVDAVRAARLRWPSVRVLLMSGYLDDMLDSRGLEELGAALLEKPFNPAALLRAVHDAMDAASPAPPARWPG